MENSNAPPENVRVASVAGRCLSLLPAHSYEAVYVPRRGVVGFCFDSQHGIHAFASDRRVPFSARANTLAYVPPGCDVWSTSPMGGEYLTVEIEHADIASEPTESATCERFNNVIDPAAIEAAHALRRLLLDTDPSDPLLLENLIERLVARVRHARRVHRAITGPVRWMTARRLRQIDEIVDARLADGLTVADLATTLNLSTGFLGRAFQAAFGMSPWRYVTARRLMRARRLVAANPTCDLAAVALDSGFASHSHMCTLFRQHLGIAPGQLRTACRRQA